MRRSTQKGWHRITHMLQIYCQHVVFYGRSMTVVGVCDVIQQMVPNEEMQKLVLLECDRLYGATVTECTMGLMYHRPKCLTGDCVGTVAPFITLTIGLD